MRIQCLMFLFVCSTCAASDDQSLNRATDECAMMKSFLMTNTLSRFIDKAQNAGWRAPVIYSQWYVNQTADTELRSNLQMSRDFGRLLVVRLSDVAATVNTNQQTLLFRTEALYLERLGNWLGTTEGYGNLLLGYRCFDIAYVCIARMIPELLT